MTVQRIRPSQAVGRVPAPPSKSYTHRALLAAYLAEGTCEVHRPLDSDDTHATRDGIRMLGARVRTKGRVWRVTPPAHPSRIVRGPIRCRESGTTLRFLSAAAALGSHRVRFVGAPQLALRPMDDLHQALRGLGVSVQSAAGGRSLPCVIQGPLTSGRVTVGGGVSSQFTSALLMVLPTVSGPSELHIRGAAVSRPYIEATLSVVKSRGIRIRRTRRGFLIPGGQTYPAGRIEVPGDASSAAYLWAAAALTGGRVDVGGIPAGLPQADLAILSILERMGARVLRLPRFIRVAGPISAPVNVDLTDSPDLFPLVSVLAAFVPRRSSRLRGAPHLAFKESDRRSGSVRIARELGARVTATRTSVEIVGPSSPRPLNLADLDDHRLVMSAAIAALGASGPSRVGRLEAVSKSFPGFWDALGALTQGEGLGS